MKKKRQNGTWRSRRCRSSLAVLLAAAVAGAGAIPPGVSAGKEAKAAMALSNPRTDAGGVTTWDCVYFGNYWQNDTNGDGVADQRDEKEPIKWRVLSVDGDDAFLLADKNLDCKPYNTSYTDVTWETCTLRSWLNGYGSENNAEGTDYSGDNFLDAAFSQEEQVVIKNTDVVNDDNPTYGTDGGQDTTDQVYLLSLDEVSNDAYGFHTEYGPNSSGRVAGNTAYAREQGADTDFNYTSQGSGWWWLRSPGDSRYDAADVVYGGYGDSYGHSVNDFTGAVRPALHLNISSLDLYRAAGTVSFRGGSVRETTSSTVRPSTPRTDVDGVTTWDCVWFGSYWQNDTNGDGAADQRDEKEPVKWRVLSVEGDDAFLLADKNLDCKPYNTSWADVTWETCTLRSWLNGYGSGSNVEGADYHSDNFMDAAFSQAEQALIRSTEVANDDHPEYGTLGGNDTLDKIFLLSIGEASMPFYGFCSAFGSYVRDSDTWIAVNTAYARGQRAHTSFNYASLDSGWWWLRSPGMNGMDAAFVYNGGYGGHYGNNVSYDDGAVRPALHLNLSSSNLWSYAGTVTVCGGDVQDTQSTPKPPSPTPTQNASASPDETVSPLPVPTATVVPDPSGTSVNQPPAGTASPDQTPSGTENKVGRAKIQKAKGVKGRKARLAWKKVQHAEGYQIMYSTGKKLKSGRKKETDRAAIVIPKLKKGKTYYFKVRAYRAVDGGRVYGGWSAVKRVRIRK